MAEKEQEELKKESREREKQIREARREKLEASKREKSLLKGGKLESEKSNFIVLLWLAFGALAGFLFGSFVINDVMKGVIAGIAIALILWWFRKKE